jgi:hypothetical protein
VALRLTAAATAVAVLTGAAASASTFTPSSPALGARGPAGQGAGGGSGKTGGVPTAADRNAVLPDSAGPGALVNTNTFCHTLDFRRVKKDNIVRNAIFHPDVDKQCLTTPPSRRPAFRVSRSTAHLPDGKVSAFPEIFTGCLWNRCTQDTRFPKQVFSLRYSAQTTWETRLRSGGLWNAAYDIWVFRHRHTTGQARGAELMIWLKTHGMGKPQGWPIYTIDGRRWWLEHWVTTDGKGNFWNYLQFRRVHPVNHVHNLKLKPFFKVAEQRGLIKPRWWIEDVAAGFEIWSGGQNLRTRWFSNKGFGARR